ncbi:unnamed protein product [Rotaria sp. Silwood2]|nr:unnamed protein product [Rotaria sp. Silwood2]
MIIQFCKITHGLIAVNALGSTDRTFYKYIFNILSMLTHVIQRCYVPCLIRRLLSIFNTKSLELRQTIPITIDIIKKGSVPLNFVQYDVIAPHYHLEVKNVISHYFFIVHLLNVV